MRVANNVKPLSDQPFFEDPANPTYSLESYAAALREFKVRKFVQLPKPYINKGTRQARRIKREYGITVDEYNFVLRQQGGVCAVCRGENPNGEFDRGKRSAEFFSVDHCHATGRVGGLLCMQCNMAIGNLRDNPELAMRAAQYISHHRKNEQLKPLDYVVSDLIGGRLGMTVFQRDGRKYYEVQWTCPVSGKKKTRSTKCTDKSSADRVAERLRQVLVSQNQSL